MYQSDSDCENYFTDTKIDKSKYNCPYYNGHENAEEVMEYAVMEPEKSSKALSSMLIKNDEEIINANPYEKSTRLLSKTYFPVTLAILKQTRPSFHNLLEID